MIYSRYYDTRKKFFEDALRKYVSFPEIEDKKTVYPIQLFEAIMYSTFSGGKRLRPILMFSAYEMLKGKNNLLFLKPLLPAAVALELVHTASLIHDDLPNMDNSNLRRGKPTCHVKFSPAIAILAGDALITKAYEVLTDITDDDKSLACLNILSEAISTRGIIGGQTVDVTTTSNKARINLLKYIHMKKTGSLLKASMNMACVMFDADEKVSLLLENYASNLGLAYQIIDDILDEVGASDVLGKEPGEDLRNNKATYVSFLGLEKAKKNAEKLISDSHKMIKNMKNNDVLIEFLNHIKDRLPL